MTVLNANCLPPDLIAPVLHDLDGIGEAEAARAAELLLERRPVKDDAQLWALLHEAGIGPDALGGAERWLYAWDDPCPCWHRVNLNDIAVWETTDLFTGLRGIAPVQAERLAAVRLGAARPLDHAAMAAQLAEAGISAGRIEALGRWLDAWRDDGTNAFNAAEFDLDLADQPVPVEAVPDRAAPGARVRLHVRNLGEGADVSVAVCGLPAEVLAVDAAESLVEIVVPEGAQHLAEVEIAVDGLPAPEPLDLEIAPLVVRQDCPDSADTRLVVQGTSMPCLLDIERPDPLADGEIEAMTLETRYFCGTNSVILNGGAAGSPFAASVSLASVNDALLYGALSGLGILAAPVTVQLIAVTERDGKKKKTVYYFYRDGKWWRVIDANRKHPEDKNGIDVRPGIPDPNIVEVPAGKAAELDRKYRPTEFQSFFDGFTGQSKLQLTIMFAMLWQMNGLGADELKVLYDIRRRLRAGQSWDQIWAAHKKFFIATFVFGVATAGAGLIFARFIGRVFRKRLIEEVTEVVEKGDEIILTIKKKYRAGKDVTQVAGRLRGGLTGQVSGRIDRGKGSLICPGDFVRWRNRTGRRRLARDVFRDWIDRLKAFARKKGLKRVEIERISTSKSGEHMLRELGFEQIEKTPQGHGIWRKVVPVD